MGRGKGSEGMDGECTLFVIGQTDPRVDNHNSIVARSKTNPVENGN